MNDKKRHKSLAGLVRSILADDFMSNGYAEDKDDSRVLKYISHVYDVLSILEAELSTGGRSLLTND